MVPVSYSDQGFSASSGHAWVEFDSLSGGRSSAPFLLDPRGRLKRGPAVGTDGEASGPSAFEMAYANDESRRRYSVVGSLVALKVAEAPGHWRG